MQKDRRDNLGIWSWTENGAQSFRRHNFYHRKWTPGKKKVLEDFRQEEGTFAVLYSNSVCGSFLVKKLLVFCWPSFLFRPFLGLFCIVRISRCTKYWTRFAMPLHSSSMIRQFKVWSLAFCSIRHCNWGCLKQGGAVFCNKASCEYVFR